MQHLLSLMTGFWINLLIAGLNGNGRRNRWLVLGPELAVVAEVLCNSSLEQADNQKMQH
ncbi:hypothetical protein [Planomicrobium sp. CPCC 101079]|uniref:hypothetical protein n=1 Tax=Planomicrobium sp. CPCC 101079 TaxID=2599618 RepID=UPI001646832D|nr:hypothetical protein [Planomicrobium sp. CPCC 101079]